MPPSWRPSLPGKVGECRSILQSVGQQSCGSGQWRPHLPVKTSGQLRVSHHADESWPRHSLHEDVESWGAHCLDFQWSDDHGDNGLHHEAVMHSDSQNGTGECVHIPLTWHVEGTVTQLWYEDEGLCGKAYCAYIGREVLVRGDAFAAAYRESGNATFSKGQRLSFLLKNDLHDVELLEGYDLHPIRGPGDYLGQRLEGEIESWSEEQRRGWIVCVAYFEGAICFQSLDKRRFRAGEHVFFEVSLGEQKHEVLASKVERCSVANGRHAKEQDNANAKAKRKAKAKKAAGLDSNPLSAVVGTFCTVQRASTIGCAIIRMKSHAYREELMMYLQRNSSPQPNFEAELDIRDCRVNLRRLIGSATKENEEMEIYAQWDCELGGLDSPKIDLIASTVDRTLDVAKTSRTFVSGIAKTLSTGGLAVIRGQTGCGKSLMLPRMLCEDHGLEPLLCTQPRRLAAAGLVSRLKAQLPPVSFKEGALVQSDVGLHVGHAHRATQSTRLLYATAGVVLKQLQSQGPDYLKSFRCVVIDEVHERSVENDLLLALIREMQMSGTRIKLVFMSATFNQLACWEWYKKVTQHQVLREAPQLVLGTCFTKDIYYLDDAVRQLGNQSPHIALIDRFANSADVTAEIDIALLDLVVDVVVHLCGCGVEAKSKAREGHNQGAILVFVPTYYFLDLLRGMLETRKSSPLKGKLSEESNIFVLHGVLDLDECLETLGDTSSTRIILASAVADSSITIPDCSFVVDLCRSNEVRWSSDKGKSVAALCWSSKSICDQRCGRTGRTRNGIIFRMVSRVFYDRYMPDWETPQVQLMNLRKEVLDLVCCAARFKSNVDVLLQGCMDPPSAKNVSSAKSSLVDMQAILIVSDNTHVPTEYGKLLSKLPLSLDDSRLVVAAGRAGCLLLGVALAAVSSSSVKIISQRFGEPEESYSHALASFGANVATRKMPNGRMEASLAFVTAFFFWVSHWRCKSMAAELLMCSNSGIHDSAYWTAKLNLEARERSWCVEHHLSRAALHAAMETVDVVLEALHTYPQPCWLQSSEAFFVQSVPQATPTCAGIFGNTACGLVVSASANILSNRRESIPSQDVMSQLLPSRLAFTKLREEHPLPPAHLKHMVLLGEGDLSFSRALQRLCLRHGRLLQATPTTLLSKSELSSFFGLPVLEAIDELSREGHSPLYCVDATALHNCKDLVIHLGGLAPFDLLQWNFPFTGEDDAVESHTSLVYDFFFSAAKLVLNGMAAPDMEIRLLLHCDQFSRWRCRQAAMDALFELTAWWEDYPLQDFEDLGYVPRRTKLPERLLLQHPVLYCFRPCSGHWPNPSKAM